MQQLLPSNLNGFLERFYDGYDGLIRKVEIDFSTKEAVISLLVQDREAVEKTSWTNLILRLESVNEFVLLERKTTCVVLTSGFKIGFFDGNTYVDLCPYTEEPSGVDDFKHSDFLIVGEQCFWSVSLDKPKATVREDQDSIPKESPKLQVTQPKDVFDLFTYRQFMDHYGHLFAEYSHLSERHSRYKTLQERLQAPEREQMGLLDERFDQWRKEYLSRLPNRLIARCPYCNIPILQPVDVFSLMGFYPLINLTDFYHDDKTWRLPKPPRKSCKHMLIATISANLNNLKPDDLPLWSLNRKWLHMDASPRVMVWPLVAQRTSAVIQALPIGRYDDPKQIYHYTAYFITYFASDLGNLLTKEMWVSGDTGRPATEGVYYDPDLRKWVEAERLLWLDPDNPSRLIKGPVDEFPYADIQPQGRYRIIENGEVEGPYPYSPRFTWQGKAPHHNESFPQTIE